MDKIKNSFQTTKLQYTKHSKYFEVYEKLFKGLYDENLTIVEIGVLHGGSLEAYKKLLNFYLLLKIKNNNRYLKKYFWKK